MTNLKELATKIERFSADNDWLEYREAIEQAGSREAFIEDTVKALSRHSTAQDVIEYLENWEADDLAEEVRLIDYNIKVYGYFGINYTGLAECDYFTDKDMATDYVWELLGDGNYVMVDSREDGTARINSDDIDMECGEFSWRDIYGQKEN